jgi:hypothetical protein
MSAPRPPVDLVGPGAARDLLLRVGRDDGDGASAPAVGDLHGCAPHAAAGAVDDHRVALAHAPATMKGEVGRVVVHDERRALLERPALRQSKGHRRRRGGPLSEAAERERHHALAGRERVAALGHLARHLGAERERRVGLELVAPAREQNVGKGHARGVDVDQDAVPAVGLRRVVDQPERVRALELVDL